MMPEKEERTDGRKKYTPLAFREYCEFLLREPGKALASPGALAVVFLGLGMAVLFLGIMFSCLGWYRKAERMLKRTGCLPGVSFRRVMVRNRICEAVCLGVFLYMIFFMGNSGWESVVTWSRSLLVVFFCSLMISVVREYGTGDRRENAIGYFVGVMVIGTLLLTLYTNIMQRFGPGRGGEEVYQRLEPFPVSFQELGYKESEIWHKESIRSGVAFYQTETGTEIDGDGGESQLHLTYYESPIPLIISGTRAYYPQDRGSVWKVHKAEWQRADGIRVTRYRYQMKEGNSWVSENPVRDTYLLSDRNRLFVLSFSKAVEEDEMDTVAGRFAEGGNGDL